MKMFTVFVILVFSTVVSSATVDRKRIAIVGGGVGGTSAAYFLQELFGENVEIDLYHRGKIGGRLANVELAGREYEVGGSILHPENMYMVNFTRVLGLKQKEPGDGLLGIFNGKSFDFLGSNWSILTMMKLFLHYGMDILNIQSYVGDLLHHFKRIYTVQDQGQSFTKPESLLSAMSPDFVKMLRHSVYEEFKNKKYSPEFIDQLVRGGLLSNYGQTTDVHAFVGAVSMAGIQPGLWSVHGGNKLIPEGLAELSGAHLIQGKVHSITLEENQDQTIQYLVEALGDNGIDIYEEVYDYLIMATPIHDDVPQIKFKNFPVPIGHFKHSFHRTVATMVQGSPRNKLFGLADDDEFPKTLLLSNADLFYNSIGKHTPVDYDPSKADIPEVYKVFSQKPLTKSELESLFETYKDVEVKDWTAAYPHYDSDETEIPSFVLYENMYYINAIELIASSMEMSVIGARNCALLLYNKVKNREGLIDAGFGSDSRESTKKQEL